MNNHNYIVHSPIGGWMPLITYSFVYWNFFFEIQSISVQCEVSMLSSSDRDIYIPKKKCWSSDHRESGVDK